MVIPMSSSDTALNQGKSVSPLHQVLSPIRGQLIVATLLAAVGAMLTLVPLFLIVAMAKDGVSPTNDLAQYSIFWIVMVSLGSLLMGMLLTTIGDLIAHMADNRITYRLRSQVAQHLSCVSLGWFSQHSSGEVKQVMQDDIAMLHSLTAHFFPVVGRAFGVIVVAVGYLLLMDWRITLIVLLPFWGFVWFLRKAIQSSAEHMQDLAEKQAKMNSAAVEFTDAIPMVKTFIGHTQTPSGYQQAVENFAQVFVRFTRPLVAAMAHAHAMIASITILGVVLLCGAIFIHFGWIVAVELLPFVLIAPVLSAPVLLLHTLLHDVQASEAAAQRVLNLLVTPILAMPAKSQHEKIKDNSIALQQVSYGYDINHLVLKDLTLNLEPNTVTAIVGTSGAGKSTLAKLLLRFFDPTSGYIRLGGVDLREIESTALYQRIGFVLQDSQLIYASIRDNITLGRPSASQQEIEQAAQLAQIHERILSLPQGYDTVLGADIQFSGGERQRLCIARAVLLDPPILVLDEATAAADAETEMAIHAALSHFVQGRTVLIVAHRLDTIMTANQIVVLDGGRIVEQGTHSQLLANQKRYAQLWKSGGYQSSHQTNPDTGASL